MTQNLDAEFLIKMTKKQKRSDSWREKNKEVQKEQQHDEEIVIQRDMESGEYFEKANIYRANNGSSSFQKIKQQQRKVNLF